MYIFKNQLIICVFLEQLSAFVNYILRNSSLKETVIFTILFKSKLMRISLGMEGVQEARSDRIIINL